MVIRIRASGRSLRGKSIRTWLDLFPQRLVLPPSGHPHSGRINSRVLGKKRLDILGECVCRIDGIEPVGDVAKVGIEFVTIDLSVGNPWIRKVVGNVRLDYDIDIPKASVVGTDVADNRNTTQPVTQILILWDHETTAHSLFCSTIVHVGIEFGKRTKRGNLQCFPYRWHRWCVVLLEMFQDELVLRTIKFFLQATEITLEHRITVGQCSVYKPKGSVSFREHTDKSCFLFTTSRYWCWNCRCLLSMCRRCNTVRLLRWRM